MFVYLTVVSIELYDFDFYLFFLVLVSIEKIQQTCTVKTVFHHTSKELEFLVSFFNLFFLISSSTSFVLVMQVTKFQPMNTSLRVVL